MDMMGSGDGMHSMGSMDMGSGNTSTHEGKQGLQHMTGGGMRMGIEKSNASHSSMMHSDMMSSDQESKLVNFADYQTAQALAVKAQQIFNEQLSNSSSKIQSLNNIKSALQELVDTVNYKGTPMDVMMIVHTKIQTL